MANTRFQTIEIETWVRSVWLPEVFGQPFQKSKLMLAAGGQFEFDAVSADKSIAASISTSRALTASGNGGEGKLNKLYKDMLFLLEAQSLKKRVMVLTEQCMLDRCLGQRRLGRVPVQIEFLLAALPGDKRLKLDQHRAVASDEVLPGRILPR